MGITASGLLRPFYINVALRRGSRSKPPAVIPASSVFRAPSVSGLPLDIFVAPGAAVTHTTGDEMSGRTCLPWTRSVAFTVEIRPASGFDDSKTYGALRVVCASKDCIGRGVGQII